MDKLNELLQELGISKVRLAKYLGVSRQMVYNYLEMDSINKWPKEKKLLFFRLLNIPDGDEETINGIKVNTDYLMEVESRLNQGVKDLSDLDNYFDFKGLKKEEQQLIGDITYLLKEKLLSNNKNDNTYDTLRYLYYYIQTMDQVEELKYILVYMAKANCIVPPLEFLYDENKQYTFEGILFSALMLYNTSITTSGGASKSKVSESHKKFEQEIESKKEEKLSRTQELNSFKSLALNELGYTSINESNAKEVFEKIAEIMSRKF